MIPIRKDLVRNFSGKIIGFIEVDKEGNKQCSEFSGKILGFYDSKLNVTRDFHGRIVCQGDNVNSFLFPQMK